MKIMTNLTHEQAKIVETSAGPQLYIGDVMVRSWLGTMHNEEAHGLATEINIKSHSVETLLLMAMLEKLEEIRCGIIDVENEINPR